MIDRAVRVLLLFCLVPASITPLSGIPTFVKLAAVLALGGGVVLAFYTSTRERRPGRAGVWLLTAAVGLSALGLVRFALSPMFGATPGAFYLTAAALVTLATFVYLAVARAREHHVGGRLTAVAFAPAAFVGLNLALYAIGFDPAEVIGDNGPATLLGYMGVGFGRTAFPLIPGLNGSGELGAVAIVCGAAFIARGARPSLRFWGGVSVAMGIAVILMADSRGVLAFTVVTLLLMALAPSRRHLLRAIPFLLPFVPPLIVWLLTRASAFSDAISRSGNDAATATGRTEVWDVALTYLSHPIPEHLWGFGAYGQRRSGISSGYDHLFAEDLGKNASLHNGILQNIIDMGYVGAFVVLALMAAAINAAGRRYNASGRPEALALLGTVIVVGLMGATEPVPTIAATTLLSVMIAATAASLTVAPAHFAAEARVSTYWSRLAARSLGVTIYASVTGGLFWIVFSPNFM